MCHYDPVAQSHLSLSVAYKTEAISEVGTPSGALTFSPMAAARRRSEICTIKFARAAVCEFVATALFIFIGLGSAFKWPLQLPNILQISLAFGLAIGTTIQAFGNISGAHLNPAVTIAFFVGNQISVIRLVFYVALQILGAIIGAGVLYAVTPRDVRGTLALNDVSSSISKK